tara:strand:+ start:7908 stop:9419 length:1512 start_codon:yes stop_codon:yes gene_type:complete
MSYRQPDKRVAFFNPTGEIIAGISEARKGIADRFKTVEDFENAASIRYQELQDSLNETETMEDTDALNLLQDQISKELDELYRLDIQTFEGDRSAYNKKKSEIEKIIGVIPGLMSIIDDEGEKLKEAQNTGNFTKQLLRSNNEDYYNFVQDASSGGKNISFRVQNGNIIAQLNGKDVFNGNAFIKAKKDGLDLVNYAGDYSKEIDETIKQNTVGLQSLVSSKIIEKINNGTVTESELKDYSRAKQVFEERLRKSPNLGALVNESTYQLFTGYGLGEDSDNMDAWTGDDMQKAATKEALIEYMIDRQFPQDDEIQLKYTEKVEKPMTEYQRESLKLNRAKIAEKRRLFEAKSQQEQNRIKDAVDTKLDRNIVHTKEAMALPRGSKQRAQKIVDVLNEARGSKKEAFEIEEVNGNFIVVDSEGKDVKGVDDYIGLLDDLNRYTILDVDILGKDEVASRDPYVQFRIGQSISKNVNNLTEEDIEKMKNANPGDEIILSDGRKIRKT